MSRSRRLVAPVALTLLATLLAAPVAAQDASPAPPLATPNPSPLAAPAGDGTGVRLATELGDIVIGLFTESAPVAAENFVNLVEAGYYDGTGFHRVVPDFVIQGGDPTGTGAGGPGYTIPDEEVVGEYGRGIVAMARSPQPDSQGSQFFIVIDDAARASLDAARTYVIFGRVLEGMDVVDAIAAAGSGEQVADPVLIETATVESVELPPEPTAAPPTAAQQAAEALAATLPQAIGDIELSDRASYDSATILAGLPEELATALDELASANGVAVEGISLARAMGGDTEAYATILAATIAGVPAEQSADVLGQLALSVNDTMTLTEETLAGRPVTKIQADAANAPESVAYRLLSGETVWFFVADDANLEAVAAALP